MYRLFSAKTFIRNKELPLCSNCFYFLEHKNNYPYDPMPSNEQHGQCKKFGEVNMVTGVVEYDLARACRLNESQCGKLGSEFSINS